MASSSSCHSRSNSLPARPHPLVPQIDDRLCRLRSSETASSSPYSSSSSSSNISHRLSGLADLYDLVNQFLQLPLTQQALGTQSCSKKWAEDELDGSIKLLDFCSAIRDLLVQSKERVQGLESILRRRCLEKEIVKEVAKYLQCRKKAVKAISNSLKDLKKSSCSFGPPLNVQRSDVIVVISTLRESATVAVDILESILLMIGGGRPRKGCWSLVSKVMEPKRVVGCELETDLYSCEFRDTDAVLLSLVDKNAAKMSDNLVEENAQNQLAKLEACVEDLEEGLECVFRRLIKTRATLLNALC